LGRVCTPKLRRKGSSFNRLKAMIGLMLKEKEDWEEII
jgi:hypothetical protein